MNQNSVSLMHMFNACLNCVVSFKSQHLGRFAETKTLLQSLTDGRTDGQTEGRTEVHTDKGKIIFPSPLRVGGIKKTHTEIFVVK